MILRDSAGDPVVEYPAESVWLATEGGGLVSCTDGTIADGPTDVNGEATITGPLRAGGYSDYVGGERSIVVIDGQNLPGSEMEIYFNSPENTAPEDLVTDIFLPLEDKS